MYKRVVSAAVYMAALLICVANLSTDTESKIGSVYAREIEKFNYQLGYTDIYATTYSPHLRAAVPTAADNSQEENMNKTAYLTFDDGPTPRTGEILDILEAHNIKATFFVICSKDDYRPYMQRAAQEGHSIGVHSASHNYKEIYRSVDAYLDDFTECYNYIQSHTGTEPLIYRFPGGSVNNYNSHTRKEIAREMARRGFIYFDWNVESGDSGKVTADGIYRNVMDGCKGKQRAVIIMHDSSSKKTTVEALDRIITDLKNDGWEFRPLTNEVKPVIFRMK